ncbi:PHP domain-containing protein, partial [bacterium]|nr:PHP domain-containing protein [bacterium]
MLKKFKMDLHLHTCLSPCGDIAMLPSRIVRKAQELGLDAIAISDHNSAENVNAAQMAGDEIGITVIGGMEITSREEVHILTLFPDYKKLMEMQHIVYQHLPGENDPDAFGDQIVVDSNDQVIDLNFRLLIGATELSVEEIVDRTHALNGLVIASHVDRERFGIIGQLGFIPPGLELDALEISPRSALEMETLVFAPGNQYPLVTFSDAHYLEDIGKIYT